MRGVSAPETSTEVPEQVAWEERWGRFAAIAAVLGAACFVAGGIYLQIALEQRPQGSNALLAQIGREATKYVIAGVLSALAFALVGAVVAYLYRATRFRRSQLPSAALFLLVFGAVTAAAVALARPVDLIVAAGDLPATALRSEDATDRFLRDRTSLQIVSGLALAANLALAFSLVLVSLNAMRAGLLSRFVGVLGIVIGVLFPFVGPMPVLLFFWLGALAALFLDRWPGGRGPAWETGEALPWPTLAQRNAEIDRRRVDELERSEGEAAEPAGGEETSDPPEAAPARDEATNGAGPSGRPSKRKRGRRR